MGRFGAVQGGGAAADTRGQPKSLPALTPFLGAGAAAREAFPSHAGPPQQVLLCKPDSNNRFPNPLPTPSLPNDTHCFRGERPAHTLPALLRNPQRGASPGPMCTRLGTVPWAGDGATCWGWGPAPDQCLPGSSACTGVCWRRQDRQGSKWGLVALPTPC